MSDKSELDEKLTNESDGESLGDAKRKSISDDCKSTDDIEEPAAIKVC